VFDYILSPVHKFGLWKQFQNKTNGYKQDANETTKKLNTNQSSVRLSTDGDTK